MSVLNENWWIGRWAITLTVLVGITSLADWSQAAKPQDRVIRRLAAAHGLTPLVNPPAPATASELAQVELGRVLFFDQLLSGNRDTSCATCHHPQLATGDALALPVGTGTTTPGALGIQRVIGPGRHFVPRNAPEVFNRGDASLTSMFWDSRIEAKPGGGFISPAGDALPAGFSTPLEVQAMFPVTSRDEMRGSEADAVDPARNNELAAIADDDLPAMWNALMDRLLAIPAYRTLFSDAYGVPDEGLEGLGFEFAAKAIAAFEVAAFSFDDSPWDEYLRGSDGALTAQQKQGAVLFMTKGRCVQCHNGPLLTDLEHYNLAVPQLGPGKAPEAPEDFGRFRETLRRREVYHFRTPPLRNVAATGPWFHDGAYNSLRKVIQHHANPQLGLYQYDGVQELEQPELWPQVLGDSQILRSIARGADIRRLSLSSREIDAIVAFLESLTAPDLNERLEVAIPETVPSGIPVERLP